MSQSRIDIVIHIVWATYLRQPLLNADLKRHAHRLIAAEATKAGLVVLAIGGTEDHVHILVRTGARIDLSRAVNLMKGVSSHALNDQIPGRAFGWQNGYAALSVSPKHVARVQEYVRRQMEHHRCGEVHEDWEQAGP